MMKFIESELSKIREANLWRTLPHPPAGCINFSTNDYLGLSRDPRLAKGAADAMAAAGAGGGSSRLISGTSEVHRRLETELARLKGTESCLIFPSGYMANLAVMTVLLGEGDAVILDRLDHASLFDRAKASRARVFVYDHASPESLEKVLKRTRNYSKRLVATDTLFSMDGDLAPLTQISELTRRHGVWLMIDDAHATGVLEERPGQAEIVMGTLSKALGSQGGFVCGPKALIDFLVNRARPFIYTTALSPAACGAALAALDIIRTEPERRKKLVELSARLGGELRRQFPTNSKFIAPDATPIVPFWTGSAERALEVSGSLQVAGVFAPAIRPPTVPKGECRLRFSLTSNHTPEDINLLLGALTHNLEAVS